MTYTILQPIKRSFFLFVILTISFTAELSAQSPSVPSIKALHEYAEKKRSIAQRLHIQVV